MRAELLAELDVLQEMERRRRAYPLAWVDLWHQPPPRTSQRRALLPLLEPEVMMLAVLGGNRSGKSELGAMYTVAMAAGRDAMVDTRAGSVRWVERWLDRNELPHELIPTGPGRMWVGSPTFEAAVEQIRPKLARFAPGGSRFMAWEDKRAAGEIRLPNGGVIVSKAYKQYDQDPQSWEGAAPRGITLDEEANQRANLTAAMSRLVDHKGKILNLLTPLRGKTGWYYREIAHRPPPWVRIVYLHGADNPHVPQDWREMMIAATPAWQRASRDTGAFTTAEGAIYPLVPEFHVIEPTRPPEGLVRWRAIDWGGRSPHAIWAYEASHGGIVVYREYAPRRTSLEPAITDRQLLEEMLRLEAQDPPGTVYGVADSENPQGIVEAAALGMWLEPAKKGPGSVVEGINLVEHMLQTVHPLTREFQVPQIHITRDCPQLLEELGGMRWANLREGQDPRPDPACPDHGPDALRYLAMFRQALGFR